MIRWPYRFLHSLLAHPLRQANCLPLWCARRLTRGSKTLEMPTGHVIPQCIPNGDNPNSYLDEPIMKGWCQEAMCLTLTDSPYCTEPGLCGSLLAITTTKSFTHNLGAYFMEDTVWIILMMISLIARVYLIYIFLISKGNSIPENRRSYRVTLVKLVRPAQRYRDLSN